MGPVSRPDGKRSCSRPICSSGSWSRATAAARPASSLPALAASLAARPSAPQRSPSDMSAAARAAGFRRGGPGPARSSGGSPAAAARLLRCLMGNRDRHGGAQHAGRPPHALALTTLPRPHVCVPDELGWSTPCDPRCEFRQLRCLNALSHAVPAPHARHPGALHRSRPVAALLSLCSCCRRSCALAQTARVKCAWRWQALVAARCRCCWRCRHRGRFAGWARLPSPVSLVAAAALT